MNSRILGAVVCALIFNQSLRAFSTGPPANRNGVSGVFCTACHRTFDLNSGQGSVRIMGLPLAWSPGESYALQVVVSDPAAIRFGFEFSATAANGDQAGELIAGADGRTRVISGDVNGKTVQFIEHTSAGSTIGSSNVFQFTYRAPTDTSFGNIRFNVAGNAANGNGANTGDNIYATEMSVPVLVLSSERQFVLATRGASSVATLGNQTAISSGFARVVNGSGTTGAGLAFISYGQSNALLNEAGFAASAPVRSGTVYAEVGGSLNTALALVNTNSQAAAVSFFFAGDDGGIFGQSSVTIPANSQVAGFLDQAPFFTPNPFSRSISTARTFTFTAGLPVSPMAVRTRLNERGEFMLTALPIATASSTSAVSVPVVGDGAGLTSEVLLINGTDATETGTVQFNSGSGQSMSVTIDGQTSNTFTYSIPARSARRFKTAGSSSPPAFGWVEVTPSGNTRVPLVAAVLTARTNNVTVTETAVGGSSATSATRVYAELSGNFAGREPRSVQTGLAVSNSAAASVTISIDATSLDGALLGTTTLNVPARGEVALLLGDVPGLKLPASFAGTLWVSAPAGSSVSVAGFRARYNDRQTPEVVVSAFPAFDESAAASELVFPEVVDSGGYSTQFVLLGARGAQASGSLQFISRDGQPLRLGTR